MAQQTSLPGHASVVVIGGGIMGCSTLYHLAKGGIADCVLLERNRLTSGTTWHSAAQVRALRSTRNLTELIRYSISLYSDLESETGQSTGWINKGSLSIATSDDRLVHIRRQEALAHLYGVRAEYVDAMEALERWPLMNADDVVGAVWSPDDGRVSPSDLCAALVKGARSRGASIFEDTPVTGIATRGGRVKAVETPAGTLRCDAIVLCAGLWSRRVAAMAGADAPIWPCEHFYLLTDAVPGIHGNLPTLSDHDSHLYIRDDSGGLLIGCFEPMGKAVDPADLGEDFAFQLLPEDWDHFEPMMRNALHRLPVLEAVGVRTLLNGPESFTPDGSFMLGESAETRGFFLGCGMNSVGVATGGGAGMALAHCVIHGHTPTDLHEADPKRFPACFNSVPALASRVPEILGQHYAITYPGLQKRTARNLALTPLHEQWSSEGAVFGQFFGWERPLYFAAAQPTSLSFGRPAWFAQVGLEVDRAHRGAALFEQSTFGKVRVEGSDAERFLNRVCANDMTRPPGSVVYTAMLNDSGRFESDLTAFRLDDETYRLYTGTAAIKRDLAWLRAHVEVGERVTLVDESADYAVIALMGPGAVRVAAEVGAGELSALGYFKHGQADVSGRAVLAARVSYVGEAGWEITCDATDAAVVYQALYAAGARPAGLYAQTSMRVEKRYLAFGHDIDGDTTPLEAGIGFAVAWETDFIGREALQRLRVQGTRSRLVTLVFEDAGAVPIGNEPVYVDGVAVGKTTSAAYGYRVGAPVAIAQLTSFPGATAVDVDIARTLRRARVIDGPAFDPEGLRMRSTNG